VVEPTRTERARFWSHKPGSIRSPRLRHKPGKNPLWIIISTSRCKYYENQRYEDCVRAAREALKIDPNLGEAYANIATAHTMGKVDEAIAALQEEVRINPNLRSATRNLNIELAIKTRSGH
jgi:tetratricopeptide (TPR) repeat protein